MESLVNYCSLEFLLLLSYI